MTQTASDRFGEDPEYFPVVPLQCPYLTFTNSDFSMSLNSSSVLTLLAQTAPLQAGELPAQGNLGIKSTRCLPQRFPGRISMGSSSLERWWVYKHPHQLRGRLGHPICTHTSPSASFWAEEEVCSVWPLSAIPSFFFLHTPPQRAAVCQTEVSPVALPLPHEFCVPRTPLKPHPSLLWAPRAAARLRLCEHTLYTWPIILAMSPTSVQLQQSWIGPCSRSETATAHSWSSDSYTMKPFTRLINSGLCVENNCVIWVSD